MVRCQPQAAFGELMVDRAETETYLALDAASATGSPSRLYENSKRLLDLLIAMVGLVLSAPLALVIWASIRIESRGPALFRQKRIGRFGASFYILKFRTMYHRADEDLHRNHVHRLANSNGQALTLRVGNDPRITRVGRFLRRWSLDELPNLWNVLKGEMSMVGPRPLVPYEIEVCGEEALRRLWVKPGVTGLAQVNGRLDVSINERTDYDLVYVGENSLGRDIAIMARTPLTLLRRRGI